MVGVGTASPDFSVFILFFVVVAGLVATGLPPRDFCTKNPPPNDDALKDEADDAPVAADHKDATDDENDDDDEGEAAVEGVVAIVDNAVVAVPSSSPPKLGNVTDWSLPSPDC